MDKHDLGLMVHHPHLDMKDTFCNTQMMVKVFYSRAFRDHSQLPHQASLDAQDAGAFPRTTAV